MVYVDKARVPFKRMKLSHMVADTHEELIDMATKLELNLKWLQYPGTYKEHFDVSEGTRKRAIDLGALEVSSKEIVRIIRSKKPL